MSTLTLLSISMGELGKQEDMLLVHRIVIKQVLPSFPLPSSLDSLSSLFQKLMDLVRRKTGYCGPVFYLRSKLIPHF